MAYPNYGYYPQQQSPMMQMQMPMQQPKPQAQYTLKGRPVSSIEEVKASPIDFDGSVFFFPDLANRKIYTKQINMDGTSSMYMYELKELPYETAQMPNLAGYITRDEFENALKQIHELLEKAAAAAAPTSTPLTNF